MNKILIAILLISVCLISAEFDIVSFKENKLDLAGRRNIVNDKNDNPCALIRIETDLEELKVEGDGIIKKGRESSGKYYLYVDHTSEGLNLIAKGVNSTFYKFPFHLESTIVYNMELSKWDGLTDIFKIKDIINSEHQGINGIISNLQVAPFNNNIISFEVNYDIDLGVDADKTLKLFIYNIETQKLLRIESSLIESDGDKDKKFYTKDRSLQWHPSKNWFVFNGNGYKNRENIYICKIIDPTLTEPESVKGYLIDLYDQRNERSYGMYPTFDAKGNSIFFSRQVKKRDRKAKYNKSYNLAVMKDIFDYESQDFKQVNFKSLLEEKYDQLRIDCSPVDPDLVAFISYKNKIRKSSSYYAEYDLKILNVETGKVITVDELNGFRDYSFQWNLKGDKIFYNKAVSLASTEKDFIKKQINKVNLQFASVANINNNFQVDKQSNSSSYILLKDVPAKNNGIAFVNDNKIVVSKYDPYNSLCLVDIERWKNDEDIFYDKLDFEKDTDCPAITNEDLFYIEYEYPEDKTIVSVKKVKIFK